MCRNISWEDIVSNWVNPKPRCHDRDVMQLRCGLLVEEQDAPVLTKEVGQ